MENKFDSALKSAINNKATLTENGANAFATSGKKLLDLNFAVSSLRGASAAEISKMFQDAFFEQPLLATKWLFFARDCRGGMGERRLFKICFNWLAASKPALAKSLIPIAAEYGRFDDLLDCSLEKDVWDSLVDFIAAKLKDDMTNAAAGKPTSLLAKWLPSCNTSSPKTRALAKKIRIALGMSEKQYRKTLSMLRSKTHVVEVDASAGNWSAIDYNTVPSLANLKYKNAFMKHDAQRRSEYLKALVNLAPNVKINAAAAFPCDIVSKYVNESSKGWSRKTFFEDATLEAMWKALPDYVAGNKDGSTMCVIDSSGSMEAFVGTSRMTALDVANSLGVYFSEKLTGPFKDKFITFSESPKYIDLSNAKTLADKLTIAYRHSEVANTDLKKTFMLILKTAIDNNLKQEDLPSTLLILSDMNFDQGSYGYSAYDADKCALMKEISDEFAKHCYTVPRCVWWNIIGGVGRKAPIPIQQMKNGCALVSGFSPSIAKMIFSAKLDPYDVLVDALNVERYKPIEDVYNAVMQ